MYDLVMDENKNKLGESKIHTLTYKQPDSLIASTIARQLESYYGMKQQRQTDCHGQNTFSQYRQFVEQESQYDEIIRDFIAIYKNPLDKEYQEKFENLFKLALQVSPFVIQE